MAVQTSFLPDLGRNPPKKVSPRHSNVHQLLDKSLSCKVPKSRTPENLALIYLKFKQRGKTLGYFVKRCKMEMQIVKTLIRLLLKEQSGSALFA